MLSRVESNTLYIAPNLCLRLSGQVVVKLGNEVLKGNNFVQKLETFLKCAACPIDRTVPPIDWTTHLTRAHLLSGQLDIGSDRSDLG